MSFTAEQREAIMREAREHVAWKPAPREADPLADLPNVIARQSWS